MENKNINWTKEDLKTYLLIYCANADFSESKIEIEFIKSMKSLVKMEAQLLLT